MTETYRVNSEQTKRSFLKFAEELYDQHKFVEFSWRTGKQRTLTQNRAIHLYCEMLANALNDHDLDLQKTLTVPVRWSKDSVKLLIFHPVMEAQVGVDSTTKLERKDISVIYDVINRYLSTEFGVYVEFPSDD